MTSTNKQSQARTDTQRHLWHFPSVHHFLDHSRSNSSTQVRSDFYKSEMQMLLIFFLSQRERRPYSDWSPRSTPIWTRPLSVLFYFVPQEKGLIWRPPWGWKNMGESILHWKNRPNDTKKWPKVGGHMPRSHGNLSEFFFVHYSGRSSHFSEGHRSVCPRKY